MSLLQLRKDHQEKRQERALQALYRDTMQNLIELERVRNSDEIRLAKDALADDFVKWRQA